MVSSSHPASALPGHRVASHSRIARPSCKSSGALCPPIFVDKRADPGRHDLVADVPRVIPYPRVLSGVAPDLDRFAGGEIFHVHMTGYNRHGRKAAHHKCALTYRHNVIDTEPIHSRRNRPFTVLSDLLTPREGATSPSSCSGHDVIPRVEAAGTRSV